MSENNKQSNPASKNQGQDTRSQADKGLSPDTDFPTDGKTEQ